MGLITCSSCGKREDHHAKNLCSKCYKKDYAPPIVKCVLCGLQKPHHAKGYCEYCYNKTFHKEYFRMYSRKRYSGITKEVFYELPKECIVCGFNKVIDVHHVKAKSKGGTHEIENLVVLCPNHHKMIHHADYSEEIKKSIAEKMAAKNKQGEIITRS